MAHALAPGAALAYIEVPDNLLVMYYRTLSWTVAHLRPDVVSCSTNSSRPAPCTRPRQGPYGEAVCS